MVLKRISLFCVLLSLAMIGTACAPSIVGSGAGVYSSFKLYAVADGDLTGVYNATLKALENLEIEVTDKAKDVFSARVVAKAADGKVITVNITPGENDLINFTIKVGVFGNEYRSRMIYDKIQQNLNPRKK